MKTLQALMQLMRIDKPIGWLLILWPCLSALCLASHGRASAKHIVIFSLGVFIMRAAGCIINDLADRKFDGHVERTKLRPLANQRLSLFAVFIVLLGLLLLALCLVLLLNRLSLVLAMGFLCLTIIYPFCKRFTHLPQVVLGITFNGGIPIAFAAETNTVPIAAWGFLGIMILWTVVYDTFYAMVDRNDDKQLGLRSTAILFGQADRLITAILQLFILIGLWLLGHSFQLSHWYHLSVFLIFCFFTYQQYLIRHRQAEQCLNAFVNSNWPLCLLFLGVFLSYRP